jgi:hypothetical protein
LTHIREGSEKGEENKPRTAFLPAPPTFDLFAKIDDEGPAYQLHTFLLTDRSLF